MKKLFFALLLSIVSANIASAQTPITSYNVKFYQPSTTTIVATFTIQAINVQCNQTIQLIVDNVNPTKIGWDDPVNTGKFCVYTDSGDGFLGAPNPSGNMELTVTAISGTIAGPESDRVPFTKGLAPKKLTNVKVSK